MVRPGRRRVKACKKALRNAQDYSGWVEAAEEYDRLFGFDKWREDSRSTFYPHKLLVEQKEKFRQYREQGQPEQLALYMQESLHRTLGELSDPNLYNVSLS